MPRAVLDTTVLVSAFLRHAHGGASFDLQQSAQGGAFDLFISDEILKETRRVLATSARIRRRYHYSDSAIAEYLDALTRMATVVGGLPELRAVRDPTDDMILATAIVARADFLVSRDNDLLVLGNYQGIEIVTPESLLEILRRSAKP